MKIDAQIEHEEFLASLLEQESSFLMKSPLMLPRDLSSKLDVFLLMAKHCLESKCHVSSILLHLHPKPSEDEPIYII